MTSHDLKAPLITIQGFADLLKKKHRDELSEEAMHYVETIISGAEDLNTLVTDLLTLSKAGLGKRKVASIALSEVIRSSLQSLHTIVTDNEAEFSVSDDLPVVSYDPTQLREVFTNLLANTVKYSKPNEKPKITIGWEEKPNENIVWVKDNGIGIEPKYLNNIFQPFERIARDQKGTGLGLSIAKRIVERHGGLIWVDSQFGSGSTFYFTIPKEVI